jgi:hypothetical protein
MGSLPGRVEASVWMPENRGEQIRQTAVWGPARRNAAMPAGRDRALAAVTARRRQCALPPARKRAARGVPP